MSLHTLLLSQTMPGIANAIGSVTTPSGMDSSSASKFFSSGVMTTTSPTGVKLNGPPGQWNMMPANQTQGNRNMQQVGGMMPSGVGPWSQQNQLGPANNGTLHSTNSNQQMDPARLAAMMVQMMSGNRPGMPGAVGMPGQGPLQMGGSQPQFHSDVPSGSSMNPPMEENVHSGGSAPSAPAVLGPSFAQEPSPMAMKGPSHGSNRLPTLTEDLQASFFSNLSTPPKHTINQSGTYSPVSTATSAQGYLSRYYNPNTLGIGNKSAMAQGELNQPAGGYQAQQPRAATQPMSNAHMPQTPPVFFPPQHKSAETAPCPTLHGNPPMMPPLQPHQPPQWYPPSQCGTLQHQHATRGQAPFVTLLQEYCDRMLGGA
eukprot:TRINITY_DN27701_c0_g1_i1.p1 TRINITY_DN27701_c0_g1~~TRINITY_DN27701_c0_g1_i1.p1  ORF type:complete len:436 (+),score=45.43 TRINITY_DN27701_c0_g1_i1:198-1310(+)